MPGPVRPARPDRWLALAWIMGVGNGEGEWKEGELWADYNIAVKCPTIRGEDLDEIDKKESKKESKL